MEFLPAERKFIELKKNEDAIEYERRKLRWEIENWRMMASRINFLLDRVNVTNEKSEDGKRYMKVEFILPGNTRNDDNNWRFLFKSKDEDSDGIDEVFDIELQMHRSGEWVTSDIWHG